MFSAEETQLRGKKRQTKDAVKERQKQRDRQERLGIDY